MKSQKATKQPKERRWMNPFFNILTIVVIYVATLFIPLVKPYTQFPLYVIACGRLPVIANDFAAAYSYTPPGSESYGVHMFAHYYCTPEEAEAHGYHRLSWDRS